MQTKAQLVGVNLIVNGDAEIVPVIGNGWFDVHDLGFFAIPDNGIWYLPDSSFYPNPQHNDNGTHQAHGGLHFFSTGVNSNPGADQSGTMTQTIDLTNPAINLASQDLVFNFQGFVSTDGNSGPSNANGDILEIKIDYVNGLGGVVHFFDTTWTASIQLLFPPTDINWHQILNTTTISAADNITHVNITITGTNDNGFSTIQAFFDDLSLVATVPLPIDLLTFTGVQQEDKSVDLRWQTAQEVNSHFIEVQRSADGKTFLPIGQVAAAGNSNIVKNYSFVDAAPLAGANFYRLRLVDLDNSFKYSKTLQIRSTTSDQAIEVFSNPFHDQIGLRIAATSPDRFVLSLMDATGRTVLRQSVSTQVGNNFVNLYPSTGMAAGVYFLHIQGTKTDQTIRVLKQ